MLHLLGAKEATANLDTIEEVFLKRLPKNVRFSIVTFLDCLLEMIATIADIVMVVLDFELGDYSSEANP